MAEEGYPIKWQPLSESVLEDLKSDFDEGSLVFECLESNGVWMNKNIIEDGPKIYNFQLRPGQRCWQFHRYVQNLSRRFHCDPVRVALSRRDQ